MKIMLSMLSLLALLTFNTQSFALGNPLASRCEQLAKNLVALNAKQRTRHCIEYIHKASKDTFAAKLYLDVGADRAAYNELMNTKNWLGLALNRSCRDAYAISQANQEAVTISQLIKDYK
jgi:hypothetical protein